MYSLFNSVILRKQNAIEAEQVSEGIAASTERVRAAAPGPAGYRCRKERL